jgi:hypothetical protein
MTVAAASSIDTPDAHAARPAAARRRRWPAVVLALLLLLVAGWVWLVPRVVEGALLAQLRAAGFADAEVGAVAVAFDHVDVRDLRFAGGTLGTVSVPRAVATFRAADLAAGRVDTLVLEQPVWTMAPEAPSAAPAAPAAPANDGGGGAAATPANVVPAPPLARVLPELPLRRLELRGARVVAAPGTAFAGAAVDAVFAAEGPRWQLTANATVGAHTLRAEGRWLVGDELASGDVDVRLLGAQPLPLYGPCRLELVGGERVLVLALQRGEQPFDVALGAQTLRGSGTVELRARVPLSRLDAARIDLQLAELGVATGNGLELDGLSGHVVLTGLPRPVSDGAQLLRWRGLRFAKIAVGTGEARLELRPGLELLAQVRQRAQDEVGSIEVRGVRLAPGIPSVPATIAFDEVALQEWLELLSRNRVTGEGRLTGTVDVVVHTEPRLELDLHGGQLAAVRGGLVRFLEDDTTKALIQQHAEQIAAASGHGNVVKDRIVGALEEFEYSELEFRIERDPEGAVMLQVHAAGQGRKVPQQLELDVNLRGFDAAVDTALALKLGYDRARRQLDDRVERGAQTTDPGPDGQRKR